MRPSARPSPARGRRGRRRGFAAALTLALAACSPRPTLDAATITIRHALWDADQRPLYQSCATAFEAASPGVRIRIEQLGWDDYWTGLATGFVSGTAPDVFTNHLMRYPDFVVNGVMHDLTPHIERDGVDLGIYEPSLVEMWRSDGAPAAGLPEGVRVPSRGSEQGRRPRQYALPTDWDTLAMAVNVDHLKAAGLSLDDLRTLDWNPRDGGSFGRVIERLTVDEQGRRFNEPGFDRRRVRTWGYMTPGAGGMFGQSEWSHFAASTGWRYQRAPWDPELRYDDPRLVDTFRWLASLPVRGISPTRDQVGKIGAEALFLAGRVSMLPSGSWMIGWYQRMARVKFAFVPLPKGPSGAGTSMLNSLALSVWAGSKHPEQAWQWVKYVGSRECQARIAEQGMVYPAVRGLGQVAAEVQKRRGADVQPYIDAAAGTTFLAPIVVRPAEINDLMMSAIERVLYGGGDAAQVMGEAARQARALAASPP
jgi:multiple sugar transport system substrate-binding protein